MYLYTGYLCSKEIGILLVPWSILFTSYFFSTEEYIWKRRFQWGAWFINLSPPPPINTKQLGRKTKALENFWHRILSHDLFTNFMCSPWREMCVDQQKPRCHKYSVLSTIRVMLGFREFLWRLHRAAKNVFKNVISPT